VKVAKHSISSIAEWLVLGLVLLATMSVGIEPESVAQDELEVTNLSGTITLATRASMDALGLDDFDKGATANVNVDVQNVVSSDCANCTGILIQGPVNITELTGGGSGRIEANIEVVHLREYVGEGLFEREWFTLHWDVTGGDDFSWEIMIVHTPPAWMPDNRLNAGFLDNESRTGPWILIDTILEGAQNVQGCLPDRSMPCLATSPDIDLTSTLEVVKEPTTIPHPNEWIQVTNLSNVSQSPEKTEQIRDILELGEATESLHGWCIGETDSVTQANAWSVIGSSQTAIAPMGIYLEALTLPSASFTPTSGTWTEVDLEDRGCATLVDEDQNMRMAISISET